MVLTFKNNLGTLRLYGGGRQDWRISGIDGIGLPEKEYNSVTYTGRDGQFTLSERILPRIITISGDLQSGALKHELTRAARILSQRGIIKIQSEGKMRRIEGCCTAFDTGTRRGTVLPFVIQFVCDSPFFEDYQPTTVYIFRLLPMLHKTFTPSQTMFSKRLTEAYINNLGDVKAEPVLKITNTSGEIPQGGDCAVTIHNHTNGKRIEYSYPLQPGEEVVIDIPKRRMTNNKGESILHTLSDDSFLSDFYLDKRLNHISVTASGLSHISAACTFSNKYIEAVI